MLWFCWSKSVVTQYQIPQLCFENAPGMRDNLRQRDSLESLWVYVDVVSQKHWHDCISKHKTAQWTTCEAPGPAVNFTLLLFWLCSTSCTRFEHGVMLFVMTTIYCMTSAYSNYAKLRSCATSASFLAETWVSSPQKYLFWLCRKIFSGSKYRKKNSLFNFEKGSAACNMPISRSIHEPEAPVTSKVPVCTPGEYYATLWH